MSPLLRKALTTTRSKAAIALEHLFGQPAEAEDQPRDDGKTEDQAELAAPALQNFESLEESHSSV